MGQLTAEKLKISNVLGVCFNVTFIDTSASLSRRLENVKLLQEKMNRKKGGEKKQTSKDKRFKTAGEPSIFPWINFLKARRSGIKPEWG